MAAVRDPGALIAVAESFQIPDEPREVARGLCGMDTGPMQLLTEMVKTAGAKTVVVAFGNPYTVRSIGHPNVRLHVFNTVVSASSLARALFGEIPIHGRLPVSIPNLAPRGAGLDRERSRHESVRHE